MALVRFRVSGAAADQGAEQRLFTVRFSSQPPRHCSGRCCACFHNQTEVGHNGCWERHTAPAWVLHWLEVLWMKTLTSRSITPDQESIRIHSFLISMGGFSSPWLV